MDNCIARPNPGCVSYGRIHQNHPTDFEYTKQQHDKHEHTQAELDETLAARIAELLNA